MKFKTKMFNGNNKTGNQCITDTHTDKQNKE